jgi:hypothetical protein
MGGPKISMLGGLTWWRDDRAWVISTTQQNRNLAIILGLHKHHKLFKVNMKVKKFSR